MKIYKMPDEDHKIQMIKDFRYAYLIEGQQDFLGLRGVKDIVDVFYQKLPAELPFIPTQRQKDAFREKGFVLFGDYQITIDEDLFKL